MQPKTHEAFSRDAADLYEVCSGCVMPKKLISAFAKGSVDEDEIGLTRARNWHFYNNSGRIGKFWIFFLHCNGSNERIFNERLKTLNKMIISKADPLDIYALAGRVAHHIQDMSSPPHVMPIYHTTGDKFDSYKPARVSAPNAESLLDDIKGTETRPPELLERAAQNTLKAVSEPVIFGGGETIENETWMKFWGGPDDKDRPGFRLYGEYGNRFGTVPPCGTSVSHLYDKNTFDRFYSGCYMRAVADTVRLLFHLGRRISAEEPGRKYC